ncbi:MAG: CaiB/BaiF CoA transferase family protein [Bacillota bacterium]|jgi:CoA:oxalate CoA-transferase
MQAALSGIRVLDLTRVLAGPYATMILADMGADVIKIERPGTGDDSRSYGPYQNGESAYFMSLNRNKRSITLDLKQQPGKEIFLALVKQADVVVENYRPGTMERLGLGYETLRDINPRLVYAAVSGFGHSGPYSQRAAYDGVVQAMGGIMSITGSEDGRPTRVGPSIGDLAAGLFCTIGILAALESRHQTGCGQKVDVAMLDCQVALLENAIARYVVTGEVPRPAGNRHSSIVPFEPFQTSDGEIMVAAGNDALWGKLCLAIGRPELAHDPRFITNPLRNQYYAELKPQLDAVFAERNTAEWLQILEQAGVPNGSINSIDQVIRDPQVQAREMIVDMDHPVAGKVTMPGIPVKLSETPGSIRIPAPVLGQSTAEILRELLGYSEQQIAALRHKGVV